MTAAPREPTAHIGLLFRGDRTEEAMSPKAATIFGQLVDAFADLNVVAEPVAYADDAVDEIRDQLLELDGVLVWVNPIHEGAKRALLDALLRDVSEQGVWVSAHPDVILVMGTKEVLYRTDPSARLGRRARPRARRRTPRAPRNTAPRRGSRRCTIR